MDGQHHPLGLEASGRCRGKRLLWERRPKRNGYSYDSNGNITCDPLRCFEIRYNLLNLASEVFGHDPEESADNVSASEDDGAPVKTIPDSMDGAIIEIKDVKAQYNTTQIKAERQLAKDLNMDFFLYVGDNTHVSINIPTNEIVRRPDLGPKSK